MAGSRDVLRIKLVATGSMTKVCRSEWSRLIEDQSEGREWSLSLCSRVILDWPELQVREGFYCLAFPDDGTRWRSSALTLE